jgi:hypothetical protein
MLEQGSLELEHLYLRTGPLGAAEHGRLAIEAGDHNAPARQRELELGRIEALASGPVVVRMEFSDSRRDQNPVVLPLGEEIAPATGNL